MTPEDPSPSSSSSSGMSRDTLLLLGALTFLILAVALTFLFTPNNGQSPEAPTGTAVADVPTTTGGEAYPSPAAPAAG